MSWDVEEVMDEHREFLKSVGDGVVEGVREGMRSGAIKGSKRGLIAGLRDCLARGLMNTGEGDFEDVAGYLSVSDISSDVEAASSGGSLREVSNAIVRQIRGRVRSADKTQRAIEHIKGRIRDELPNNPLSKAIVGKTQRALDGGLSGSIEAGQEGLGHEELEAGKARENIRRNVKSVVEEVVAAIFYRIARQITRRATAELRKELNERSLRRLERKLGRTSGQKLEQGLDKAINQVADVVFEDSADEMSFATDIDGSFHSSFKGYLSSLARGPRFPYGRVFLISVGVLALAGIVYALLPSNEPPQARASIEWVQGLTVGFSSQGSYDPDGHIVSYYWDFGDGAMSQEPNPQHTYGGQDDYLVVLTVTDNDGATSEYVIDVYLAPETLPDLVITEVWYQSYGADENRVYYRIENRGQAEAGPSLTFLYFGDEPIDKLKLGEARVGRLLPGQSESGDFADLMLADNQVSRLLVCADGENRILESDEDNNCMLYQ